MMEAPATASSSATAPALDLESSPVSGQMASAVLDLEGNLLRGQVPESEASILFEMFSQSAKVSNDIQRISVSFASGYRYVMTRDETHVYIVQARNE